MQVQSISSAWSTDPAPVQRFWYRGQLELCVRLPGDQGWRHWELHCDWQILWRLQSHPWHHHLVLQLSLHQLCHWWFSPEQRIRAQLHNNSGKNKLIWFYWQQKYVSCRRVVVKVVFWEKVLELFVLQLILMSILTECCAGGSYQHNLASSSDSPGSASTLNTVLGVSMIQFLSGTTQPFPEQVIIIWSTGAECFV